MYEEAKAVDIARIHGDIVHPMFGTTHLVYRSITCSHNLVTSRVYATLYKHVTRRNLVHWLSKYSESPVNLSAINIDWDSLEVVRKELPLGMKIVIMKWLSGDTVT